MERIICILIGYLCGLFQTGYIYGKMNHVDIRTMGSGNAGTTNALRTLGWKAGLITFIGDLCKCILAVVIIHLIFGSTHADNISLLSMYAGLGAVLGHNYPFYLGFKGGKGIASTAGLILSTIDLRLAAICLITFIVIVAVTRYVSLGSLTIVILYMIEVIYTVHKGGFAVTPGHEYEIYLIAGLLVISAFYKHKANIKRLMSGTENKLSVGKKNKE